MNVKSLIKQLITDPNELANMLVNVQPMSSWAGNVFKLRVYRRTVKWRGKKFVYKTHYLKTNN
jgi:hypothetical protein